VLAIKSYTEKMASLNHKPFQHILRERSKSYFSLNTCCSCCSAAEKNSSISRELGIKRQAEASTLRRDVIELLVLLLVVDPGVLIVSEFLIKLQGVVSLVLLQSKQAYEQNNHSDEEKVLKLKCRCNASLPSR
jgi:hypothetical protein